MASSKQYTPPASPPSPTASFYDLSDDEEGEYNTITHTSSGRGVKLLFSKSKVSHHLTIFWWSLHSHQHFTSLKITKANVLVLNRYISTLPHHPRTTYLVSLPSSNKSHLDQQEVPHLHLQPQHPSLARLHSSWHGYQNFRSAMPTVHT